VVNQRSCQLGNDETFKLWWPCSVEQLCWSSPIHSEM